MATLKVDTITSADTPTVSITDGASISGVTTFSDSVVISEGEAIHFRGTSADNADAILRASAGGGQLLINSRNDTILNIDSNADSSDAHFAVAHGAATGSSTELLRVQENGSVGIGTIPSAGVTLDIDDSGGGVLALRRNSINTSNKITLSHDGTNGTLDSTNATLFRGGGAERARLTSAGDFGIGNDSPNCKLAVKDTAEHTAYANETPSVGSCMLQLYNNPANETALDHATMQFGVNGGTHNRVSTISAVAESASNRKLALTFCTDSGSNRSERMRITGDGDVGITTLSPSSKLHLYDAASDGLILQSPSGLHYVWAIQSAGNLNNGSLAGELGLRGQSGISFSGNGGTATQVRINSNGLIPNGTDTGSANALTDYEEGTWTPAFSLASGAVGSYSYQYGKYIKIGKICYCTFRVQADDGNGDGATKISGLPFASADDGQQQYVGQYYYYAPGALTGQSHGKDLVGSLCAVDNNATTMSLYALPDDNEDMAPYDLDYGVCSNSLYIRIMHSFSYKTAA